MVCGECVDVCPTDVYELQNEKSVVVNEDECLGCESCIEVCEEKRHNRYRDVISFADEKAISGKSPLRG